jgi:hypothetical protein
MTLDSLGFVHRGLGQHREAVNHYQRARPSQALPLGAAGVRSDDRFVRDSVRQTDAMVRRMSAAEAPTQYPHAFSRFDMSS